ADVRDPEIGLALGRDRVDRVELGRRVIRGTRSLITEPLLIRRRGRDQRHPRARQRLRQRGERHADEVGPPTGGEPEELVVVARAVDVRDRDVVLLAGPGGYGRRGPGGDAHGAGSLLTKVLTAKYVPSLKVTAPSVPSVARSVPELHRDRTVVGR